MSKQKLKKVIIRDINIFRGVKRVFVNGKRKICVRDHSL